MILIIKHEEIEGPGTLGYFFTATQWDVKTVELWGGEELPQLKDCEAIISLGGPMNVYEEKKYPFLKIEDDFLKGALEKSIPVLGICLGAQLIAKCMNARVKKAKKREFGWQEVEIVNGGRIDDPLLKGMGKSLNVFQWHEDTFEIPEKAQLLATSKNCRNQLMHAGRSVWGLQFHPELTLQMIEDWVDYYNEDLDKEKMIKDYLEQKDIYYNQAQLFYQNFARIIDKMGNRK